jgi:triosephosphate isomerase
MNFGPAEAQQYFRLSTADLSSAGERVIFAPAYCLSGDVREAASRAGFSIGAQNVHWEQSGAFTGELSGAALKAMAVEWVLVAHSERRQFFGETDSTAARRLATALTLGLNTVFCVGELLEERESGKTESVLEKQLGAITSTLKAWHQAAVRPTLAIAYEPVWAIGTGRTATEKQVEEVHSFLRAYLRQNLADGGESISLLYGGSVSAQNAKSLLQLPNVDGVLVGGASLKPDSFAQIIASL